MLMLRGMQEQKTRTGSHGKLGDHAAGINLPYNLHGQAVFLFALLLQGTCTPQCIVIRQKACMSAAKTACPSCEYSSHMAVNPAHAIFRA